MEKQATREAIAFIGQRIMGKPMAGNLLKAGYTLYIYDILPQAVEAVEKMGGIPCASPKEAASKAERVLTMLPNSPEVKEVLLGENGVLQGMRPGSIVVDMSSIDPNVSVELGKKVAEAGGFLVDAPVSGGEPKAIDGTLSFMCGGEPEVFEKVRPILETMGASVTLVGEVGSGNMTKLANQIVVALNIAAVSEALVLAAKSGVDPEKVYKAIRGGLAGSTVMDAKAPMMMERRFDPGFRIDLHVKDLNNAVQAGKAAEMDLPLTHMALDMMKRLQAEGKGKLDHSALVQYYEEREQVEIKGGKTP